MLHKSVNKCSTDLAQTPSYCDYGHDWGPTVNLQSIVVFKVENYFVITFSIRSIIEAVTDGIYNTRYRRQFPEGAFPHSVRDADACYASITAHVIRRVVRSLFHDFLSCHLTIVCFLIIESQYGLRPQSPTR